MAIDLEFPRELLQQGEKTQVKRLTEYMYNLTEQLNYVLYHLDIGNFSNETAQALSAVQNQAKKAAEEAARLEQQQNKKAEALLAEIVASAEMVLKSAEVKLEAQQAALLSTVREEYAAKTETAALEQNLSSEIEQTAQNLTMRFNETNSYTLEVDGKLRELIDELQTYIRFGTQGIELGKRGSAFSSLLGSERLSFMQSGVEIAYISNNKMYITRAEVSDALSIGNTQRGYYDFQTEQNGSLSLVRRQV